MAIGVGSRQTSRTTEQDVRVLREDHVDLLRLGWQHRHDADEVRRILTIFPGRSVWLPDTREFVLVGPWRHRDDVAVIHELAAVRHSELLIGAAVTRCRDAGAALVLIAELDERRRPAFYGRIGFDELEEVVTYEMERPAPRVNASAPLTFVPVSAAEPELLETVLALDHSAFPWLWWNSASELAAYTLMPGVSLYLGLADGVPVSYVGLTSYPGWGHLDRIAVHPAHQGRGFGRVSLAFATGTLAKRGARRVGLSTQGDNVRSQRMYERFGFRRSRVNDYRLYGVWLRDPRD